MRRQATIAPGSQGGRKRCLAAGSVSAVLVLAALVAGVWLLWGRPLMRQTWAVRALTRLGADVHAEDRVCGLFESAIQVGFPAGFAAGETSDHDLLMLQDCPNLLVLDLSGMKLLTDRDLSAIERNQRLGILYLKDTPVTDEGLKHLSNCASLEALYLDNDRITDSGLAYLAGLNLRHISLAGTSVSDLGMARLNAIASLRSVALSRTAVSGIGVASLARKETIENLELAGTRLSDSGLREVGQFHALLSLDLSDTGVSDLGLKSLASLPNLESLSLRRTRVTDSGLKYIAKLENLKSLDLRGTDISDAGLLDLKPLGKLEYLYVKDTRVTQTGIAGMERSVYYVDIRRSASGDSGKAKTKEDTGKGGHR
jgi:hypothetical protein